MRPPREVAGRGEQGGRRGGYVQMRIRVAWEVSGEGGAQSRRGIYVLARRGGL